ncbi:adenosylcobinamide-phosphate synthase CbiB [Novilysobacter arseniciresistens]|nr:adenosylcobinamide-phosphate synthase CbiB [Lysobacter arseniciresistens]
MFGEPRRGHPLVGFGRLTGWIERRLYRDHRLAGVLAWSCAVLPLVALAAAVEWFAQAGSPWVAAALGALVLALAIGHRSLGEHAAPVAAALEAGDLDAARGAVARMVSRDTVALDATQTAAATTESVLENGCDAVFGALFWFVLLGLPGVVLYRLANTLDAMWGYRDARYRRFGWAAARIDDGLNLLPARLTALAYALCGHTPGALRCWLAQARHWKSPNAGPVMAAGAGAIGVRLGGAAPYHGRWLTRPELGAGGPAGAVSIRRALRLVRDALLAWLLALWAVAIALNWAVPGGLHA